MRIAVAVCDGKLCFEFEECDMIRMFEITPTTQECEVDELELDEVALYDVPWLLNNSDVDVLIAGGLDRMTVESIQRYAIDVEICEEINLSVHELIQGYQRGTLAAAVNLYAS